MNSLFFQEYADSRPRGAEAGFAVCVACAMHAACLAEPCWGPRDLCKDGFFCLKPYSDFMAARLGR